MCVCMLLFMHSFTHGYPSLSMYGETNINQCVNIASAETKSDRIQRKQDSVIVFVTPVGSKEQWEDLVGNVQLSNTRLVMYTD